MRNILRNNVVYEALMILIALLLFCVITKVWPLVFLVIPGILIAAIRLLFLSVKKAADKPEMAASPSKPPRQDTEQDVVRIAFGILQRRITEHVGSRFPEARWVWETPNAYECFTDGLPINIILNRAGGFLKGTVQVYNLQFKGLSYRTADSGKPEEPHPDPNNEDTIAPEDPDNEETSTPEGPDSEDDSTVEDPVDSTAPIDYSIVAFEWVDTNFQRLNGLCNEKNAVGESTMMIPAEILPLKDSWGCVCLELAESGFTEAVISDDGILVKLPK